MRNTANSGSRRSRGRSASTSSMLRAVAVAAQPQAAAIAARSAPSAVWLACAPVSPNAALSSTAIARLGAPRRRDGGRASPSPSACRRPRSAPARAGRLRQREAKADHRRAPHRAPQVEIQRPVAGRAGVVGGGAQAGDDQQVARIAQQAATTARRSRVQVVASAHGQNTLVPIRRCENSTATGTQLPKASAAAAPTVSATSSARSARRTCTPAAASTVGVAVPIGTCHGLNSPHSPRIVTSVRNGMRQFTGSDSMLMQLPTPEDCISSTARCAAEPGAGGQRDAFLLGRQDRGAGSSGSACAASIRCACPASGT